LFTIPKKLLLSTENSELRILYPDMFEAFEDLPWLALVLTMMYEKALGSKSKWRAYLDVLPETFDTLMWWTEEELAELQASTITNRVSKSDSDRTFRTSFVPIVENRPGVFGCEGITGEALEECVLHMAHVMATTMSTYAFDVEARPEPKVDEDGYWTEEEDDVPPKIPKAMVPLADMLNADANRNNVLLWQIESFHIWLKMLMFM